MAVETDRAELLVVAPGTPAEGPTWDVERGVVWWVDIMAGVLHGYDLAAGSDRSFDLGEAVGAVGTCTDGTLLLALRNRLAFFDPDAATLDHFVDLEGHRTANRANDGKVGPDGAFWIGTMSVTAERGAGSLYRVTPDGAVTRLLGGVSISNGLDWPEGWEADGLFYIDSLGGGVDRLRIDPGGEARRRRCIAVPEEEGLADGMCLDAEGKLWVALHNGGVVRRYDPDGTVLAEVVVDNPLTTCPAFAGPALDELYITAAGGPGGPGGLYRARPGVTGRGPHRFDRGAA